MIHVIWRQGFYPGIGAPSWTADYGNETANHFDHVHIATDGGGYPTGRETYFIGSMSPGPAEADSSARHPGGRRADWLGGVRVVRAPGPCGTKIGCRTVPAFFFGAVVMRSFRRCS